MATLRFSFHGRAEIESAVVQSETSRGSVEALPRDVRVAEKMNVAAADTAKEMCELIQRRLELRQRPRGRIVFAPGSLSWEGAIEMIVDDLGRLSGAVSMIDYLRQAIAEAVDGAVLRNAIASGDVVLATGDHTVVQSATSNLLYTLPFRAIGRWTLAILGTALVAFLIVRPFVRVFLGDDEEKAKPAMGRSAELPSIAPTGSGGRWQISSQRHGDRTIFLLVDHETGDTWQAEWNDGRYRWDPVSFAPTTQPSR